MIGWIWKCGTTAARRRSTSRWSAATWRSWRNCSRTAPTPTRPDDAGHGLLHKASIQGYDDIASMLETRTGQ